MTENEVDKLLGHPRFYEYLDRMARVHSNKNHDYAKTSDPLSNLKLTENMGWIPGWQSVIVRLADKFSRLLNFAKKGELLVKDESFVDTCIDLANYSILCAILFEENKNKKNVNESNPYEL